MFILPQAYSRPNKDLWTRLSYNLIAYIHSFSIFHCFCISCVVRIARRGLGGIWTSHLLFVFAFEVSWLAPGRVWWMCGWDGVERGYNVLFSSLVQWTLFLPEGFIRLENTVSGASGVSNVSNFSVFSDARLNVMFDLTLASSETSEVQKISKKNMSSAEF
jgi:hypothetical protein